MNTDTAQSAIVIGATGLVGAQVVAQLAQSDRYQTVYQIVRRQPVVDCSAKVQTLVIPDFSQLELALKDLQLTGADAFSTLGTTQKVAGSKQAFYDVDFSLNLHFAELMQQHGAGHFLLLSATGADAKSLVFYNRVKGELEQAVTALGFARLSIFQPSLLIGQHQDSRLAEGLAQSLFKTFKPLIPETWSYRPIEAQRVATAMLKAAALRGHGPAIYSNADMLTLTLENNQ